MNVHIGLWDMTCTDGFYRSPVTIPHGVINQGNKILIFTTTKTSIFMLLLIQSGNHFTFTKSVFFSFSCMVCYGVINQGNKIFIFTTTKT